MKTRYAVQFSDNVYPRKWYDVNTHEYTNDFATRKEALVQLEIERNNDESGEYAYRVTMKCEFFIVQTRVYTKSIIEKPRKYFWEDMPKWDFSELGGTQETKRFKTREQAERAIKRYIRKHCYGDYSSNRHRYRIVKCEVVT